MYYKENITIKATNKSFMQGRKVLDFYMVLRRYNNTSVIITKAFVRISWIIFIKIKVIERVGKRIFMLYKFVLSNSLIAKQNFTCF